MMIYSSAMLLTSPLLCAVRKYHSKLEKTTKAFKKVVIDLLEPACLRLAQSQQIKTIDRTFIQLIVSKYIDA